MNMLYQLVLYLFSTVCTIGPVSTLTLVSSRTDLSHPLTKMQLYNGMLYVGGTDNLYVLDKNFIVQQETNTCNGTVTKCNNINQLLLINDYNNANKLITCGTGNSGICEQRNLSQITQVLKRSTENIVQDKFVISSDIKRPVEAMICQDGNFMLAVTFGNGISTYKFHQSYIYDRESMSVSYESYKYAVSKRDQQFDFTKPVENTKISLNIDKGYVIYYRSSFQIGDFSYFVTNQEESIGKRNYISKLVRLCQGDNSFSSYVDIPVTCVSGEITFNMIQTAVHIKTEEESFFVGAFTRGNDPENAEGESVICIENLSDLNQQLDEAAKNYTRNCTDKDNSRRYLPSTKPRCLPEDEYKPLDFGCPPKIDTFRYAIGYEAKEMTSAFKFEEGKGYITSVFAAELDNKLVVLAGSSKGRLFQMNVGENKALTLFDERMVDVGHEIRSIRQDDNDTSNLFVMSSTKILKYERTNCTEFSTCKKTMAGRNPLCGWCIFENRASRKDSCPTNEWLHSSEQCITLETDVKGTVAGSQESKFVEVTAQHLTYRESSSDNYTCLFTDGKNQEVDAVSIGSSGNGYKFKCSIPYVADHTEATLVLKVNGRFLASTPFLFYKCSHFRGCKKCVETTGSNCTWVSEKAICKEPSPEVFVTDNSECPQLMNNTGSIFLPASESKTIVLNATNIPSSVLWCYVRKDGVDIPADEFKKARRVDLGTISCSLTISSSKPSEGQEVRIFILYGTGSNPTDLAKFEDEFDNTVTVYSCSELGKNCSHCKALKEQRFHCYWCGGKCQYKKETCHSTCPPPQVTRIIPRDGLWQGGTKVTIFGTEFGTDVSDIDGVQVAGRRCNLADKSEFGLPENDYFEKDVPSRIVCTTTEYVGSMSKYVVVNVNNTKSPEHTKFFYKNVTVTDLSPKYGPMIGGTRVTLFGGNLGVGNRVININLGPSGSSTSCVDAKVIPDVGPDVKIDKNFTIECVIETVAENKTRGNITLANVNIDGQEVLSSVPVNFTFRPNPKIDNISPLKGMMSGGNGITLTGKNMNSAHNAYIEEVGGKKTSMCGIQSSTETVCRAPEASGAVQEELKKLLNSTRTRRDDDCKGCVNVEVVVHLDGFQKSFTIKYFWDPSIHPFEDKNGVRLFTSENQRLTINGEYINLVAQESDVNITIGLENCSVFELTENYITCLAPSNEPASGKKNLPHPEVNVTIGNYRKSVGYLEYKKTVEHWLIIAGAVGGSVLAIVFIVIAVVIFKYRKVRKKAKEYETNLSNMEMEIKRVAREEFLDMHTTMSTVNRNLIEQGFPYHSYQQFACNVMFSVDYLWTEPVMTDDERLKANKGMESLESLIFNKFFLVSVITTMENEKRFFIKEKSNLAGNLCAVLMGKMDYLNEILKLLMTNLVQESSAKKHKTLFRRCESITEKLLSNWISLCLYPHVKNHSGSPLYLLYMAIQKTMESGPIDAVTGEAKYTLSEEKLLKKWSSSAEEDGDKDLKFEAKTLTLNVVVDNGEEIFKCKVLDCDTISQVKSKCLNQIYVNYPASQLPVGASDLALEWHEGFGGALKLRDEDNTSKHDGHWIRMNTLAHYNVKDESNMALIDPHSAELLNQEEYVNLANINMDGVCDGSIDSSQPLAPHDEENPSELEHWHLVKKEEESSKQGKSAIAELYLNRLFTTKQSLMEYMRPLFDIILDHDKCPPPTKFLYDFLDELGEKNRVDADTVHTWKSHSYAIRVWAGLMKMPNLLFDVTVPSFMDDNLDIISRVFIESFSLTSQKFTKDTPSQKLIFHHEMNHYRDRVKEFYKNVKVDSQNSEEFRQYMAEVNRLQQQTNFNKVSALYRFYKQLKPYFEDILENLSTSKEASNLQLDRKLEQVIAIMEEED